MSRYQSRRTLEDALNAGEIVLPTTGVFVFEYFSKNQYFVSSGLSSAEITLAIRRNEHSDARGHSQAHTYDHYADDLFERYQNLYAWNTDDDVENPIKNAGLSGADLEKNADGTSPAVDGPLEESGWEQSLLVFDAKHSDREAYQDPQTHADASSQAPQTNMDYRSQQIDVTKTSRDCTCNVM